MWTCRRSCRPCGTGELHAGCACVVGLHPPGLGGGLGVRGAVPCWAGGSPGLACSSLALRPSHSRVGFYVNTFQSIAGLEENFHKEMSKVGPRCPTCGAGSEVRWAQHPPLREVDTL